MRWVLALLFCVTAVGATWAGVRDDEPNLRLVIHEALPRPDVGDPNPLGRQLWTIWPRFSVDPPCAGARVSAGSRTLLNGRQVPQHFEGDGYSGYTVEISARVTCRDGRHARARREFLLPPASCDGGPLKVYAVHGGVSLRDFAFVNRASPVPVREGDWVSTDAVVEVPRGGQVEIAAPECNGLRVVARVGVHHIGTYERGSGGYWFSGPEIVAVGDRNGGRFYVEPTASGAPSPAHVAPLTAQRSSYAVKQVDGRVVVRVYQGVVGVSGTDERFVVEVGRLRQVSIPRGAARPGRPRLFQPNEPWDSPADGRALEGLGFVRGVRPEPKLLAPPFSRFSTTALRRDGAEPDLLLVDWSRTVRGADLRERPESGFFVWERRPDGWRRVHAHRFPRHVPGSVELGDVNGDGVPELLAQAVSGTGLCGPRTLLVATHGSVERLFHRDFCEGEARIRDGALHLREAVGPCPHPDASAHCAGGVRTTVLRWRGTRVASRRVAVTCSLPRLDPKTNCAAQA